MTTRGVSELKIEIVRRGLCQCDVAMAAGMSESRLSRLINGRAKPADFELKNLAKVLGVSREELPGFERRPATAA
jgi:transcriptional regulator with XRE-family HTH domain